MPRKQTLKLETRLDRRTATTYWVVTLGRKIVSGSKRQLPFYDLALAFAEGYSGLPLTEQYRKTGKPIYSVSFDPLEALRSLNA